MTGRVFNGFKKPYVIVHSTGFGVAESNYIEVGPVAEADTYHEANEIADKLKVENNSPEDIKSSWVYNTYRVFNNTLED